MMGMSLTSMCQRCVVFLINLAVPQQCCVNRLRYELVSATGPAPVMRALHKCTARVRSESGPRDSVCKKKLALPRTRTPTWLAGPERRRRSPWHSDTRLYCCGCLTALLLTSIACRECASTRISLCGFCGRREAHNRLLGGNRRGWQQCLSRVLA
jgi:hypothetical protein